MNECCSIRSIQSISSIAALPSCLFPAATSIFFNHARLSMCRKIQSVGNLTFLFIDGVACNICVSKDHTKYKIYCKQKLNLIKFVSQNYVNI